MGFFFLFMSMGGISLDLAIIGLIQSITVVIIGGLFARCSYKSKEAADKAEASAALRAEESRLAMKMMSASVGLGVATAIAVREGNANGAISSALEKASAAQLEYYNFVNTVASKQISK